MKYRADIDGLRAVAVWSVIFFHFQQRYPINGYMGVDVFFVISGYLITSIIQSDINNNNFSFRKFYLRRARRILPALFALLIFTTIVVYFLFLPGELFSYAKSLIATVGFGSNILFFFEEGYFDKSAIYKPLLHTWSLGIEEQFYIIFPVLLVILNKFFRNKVDYIVVFIAIVSLATNILFINYDMHSSAFYLLSARAWELFIGAALALTNMPTISNKKITEMLSILAAIIFMAGLLINVKDNQYPGYYALFPTIACALLIYSGSQNQDALIMRLLRMPVMTFMGKISYSLYLWHWPLLVLLSYYMLDYVPVYIRLLLIILCIAISFLSWKYIETPFRKKTLLKQDGRIFITSLAFMLVFCLVGLLLKTDHGMPQRFSPNISKLADAPILRNYKKVSVDGIDIRPWIIGSSMNPDDASFLLMGDSHSIAITPALEDMARSHNQTGLVIRNTGCFLLKKYIEVLPMKPCIDRVEDSMTLLKHSPNIKTVILAARWEEKANGKWEKRSKKNYSRETFLDYQEQGLVDLINYIHGLGKKVIIFAQVPQVFYKSNNVPSLLARINLYNRELDLRPTLENYMKKQKDIISMFERIKQKTGIDIIWPHKELCKQNFCDLTDGEISYYYDDDHLSVYGAKKIEYMFEPYF